ncbi:GH116 family glycosyl-hydrolase [Ferruginibacter sp.]|uniref:GH116 family glycosyl-hydrolase n=1 Tax=Ferruginibacter sp. TaxID=1940288 RepID=UPI0026591E37|nr:GH116 family glycosyl-hydrolase [Ferruginibacter sp.]
MERRNFLKSTSLLTAAGFFSSTFPLIAGPFTQEDFLHAHFPPDKKLDTAWVASLYERGNVTTYKKTKNELRYIGMPVGGICSGGVYVGGDGRLWLWDIFNQNQLGVVTKTLPVKLESFNISEINNTHGSLYLEPLTEVRPLQQGFALSIKQNGTTVIKRLQQDDWDEVTFESTYPVATIKYIDNNLPLQVSVEAFSPFIPGNADDSGLPATIQAISIKNTGSSNISVEVIGWLENKILLNSEKKNADFSRINKITENKLYSGIVLQGTTTNKELEKAADYGNMCFACLEKNAISIEDVNTSENKRAYKIKDLIKPTTNAPVAGIIIEYHLKADQEIKSDFIISWYMSNTSFYSDKNIQEMTVQDADKHYYTTRFADANAVAAYIAQKYTSLKDKTMLWKQTWYDSTLPWWFLERTFSNISSMATTTTHRFQSGRYYAWEGVGCCHGNCTHVYQYAQAVSRIFPELERDTRERVDLGIGYDEATGMIHIRGEKTGPSIDGQAGTVLRIYREHQMSSNYTFLRKNWAKIKKAVIFIMVQDKNKDGMEDTPMENTLDALWHGEIAWIVGLCIAGVRAGQAMAEEMEDMDFAERCRKYIELGSKNMEQYLFNGEYFIHRPDPSVGKKEIGSFNTCHIDQVYGQGWVWQVGLERILSKEKTMSALQALWKYNYMPDVGPYIKTHSDGRFYALAGEGGMIMNTNPYNDDNPYGNAKAWQVGYFSECMSGFEHQVASHMMAEGMIKESLVLTRSIHDRYHAFKRNPFNEVECSDHYGRAMASYGTFVTACGFTYHGPKGQIGFAPKLTPENFKAPFTSANGWGSYSQQRNENLLSAQLKVSYGNLNVKKFTVELDNNQKAAKVEVKLNTKILASGFKQTGNKCEISLKNTQLINAGKYLTLQIS